MSDTSAPTLTELLAKITDDANHIEALGGEGLVMLTVEEARVLASALPALVAAQAENDAWRKFGEHHCEACWEDCPIASDLRNTALNLASRLSSEEPE